MADQKNVPAKTKHQVTEPAKAAPTPQAAKSAAPAVKPVEAAPVPGPVGRLVRERGIVAPRLVEGRDRRHVNKVGHGVVVGARVLAGADVGAGRGKEGVKLGIGGGAEVARFIGRGGVKLGGQAVDLLGVEHAIGFQIGTLRASSAPSPSRSAVPNFPTVADVSPLRTCPPASFACR